MAKTYHASCGSFSPKGKTEFYVADEDCSIVKTGFASFEDAEIAADEMNEAGGAAPLFRISFAE
jgi:hypothetical protein